MREGAAIGKPEKDRPEQDAVDHERQEAVATDDRHQEGDGGERGEKGEAAGREGIKPDRLVLLQGTAEYQHAGGGGCRNRQQEGKTRRIGAGITEGPGRSHCGGRGGGGRGQGTRARAWAAPMVIADLKSMSSMVQRNRPKVSAR